MAEAKKIAALSKQASLAQVLDLVAYFYRLEKNTYRALSYEKAAKAVAKHPYQILSGQQARDEIRGIGESIGDDIDSFLREEKIPRLEALRAKFSERIPTVELFSQIFGVGPIRANQFYDQGYRTLEDLYFGRKGEDSDDNQNRKEKSNLGASKPVSKPGSTLPEVFSDLSSTVSSAASAVSITLPPVLSPASRLSLRYRKQLALRIPRAEIDLAKGDIANLWPSSFLWEIAGSYRRGEPDSGDIDLLLRGRDREGRPVSLARAVQELRPLLVGDLAQGEVMYMGILRLLPHENFNARRLDILLVPEENWGPALLHFTGSREFNILLRQRAKDLGLSLNEKRLAGAAGAIPAESEEKIFDLLGVEYLKPEERVKGLSALTFVEK